MKDEEMKRCFITRLLKWEFLVLSSSCSLLPRTPLPRKSLCTLRRNIGYAWVLGGQLGGRLTVLVHVC